MPGKPGRSGRPPTPCDHSISPPTPSTSMYEGSKRGRPPKMQSSQASDDPPEVPHKIPELSSGEEKNLSVATKPTKPSLRVRNNTEAIKDDIIGEPLSRIPSSKLPTRRLVYHRWRALRLESQMNGTSVSNREIACQIAQEIQDIWTMAHIPTRRNDRIKDKIHSMIEEVLGLLNYGSRLQKEREPRKKRSKS